MKTFTTTSLILMMLLAASNTAFADLNAGLVAHYQFNGNANDESGNGNHGSTKGGAWVNTPSGQGILLYDGQSNWVTLKNGNGFSQIPKPFDAVTIASVIKLTRGDTYIYSSQTDDGWFYFTLHMDKISLGYFYNWGAYNGLNVPIPENFDFGQFHHIVGILERGKISIYIDSNLLESSSFPNYQPLSWSGTANCTSGIKVGGSGCTQNGTDIPEWKSSSDRITTIDDLRIYNRALSAAEVRELYSTISNFVVGEGTIPETGLRFTVTLSEPLPDGYGVFVNFDDQQGGWFEADQDGWHLALEDQSNNVYAADYVLDKPGLRSFRAGVFRLNGAGRSDDTLVGSYTAPQTCTLASCLAAVALPSGYGDPAVTGGGSELFKQVDVSNGNYHLAATDMSVDGKGPAFAFSRAYNALALGPWTFAYEAKATFVAGSYQRQVTIGPREDGHTQFFYKDMDNLWYTLNPGNFDRLIEDPDGSFVLYTQGNRLYRFASPVSTEAGRLKSIDDRVDNVLTFHYSASGNYLVGATDANGRGYAITRYANHRIQRVTDFSGRFVEYTYDANGMITDVRNMRGDHHRYTYVGATGDDRYRLASIIDPRGHEQMTIDYALVSFTAFGKNDTQGRVVRLTDGADAVTAFSYPFIDTVGSPFYLRETTAIRQPAVNGVNSNVAFILDNQRTRVEKRLDIVNAAEYVRTQGYKALQDRQHVAETALVEQVIDPKGHSTDISYDGSARNRPATVTDADENQYLASYQAIPDTYNLSVLASAQQPGVPASQFGEFSRTGQAGRTTDPSGYITSRLFDTDNDWMTEQTNPLNNTTRYDHDDFGHVTNITEPLNRQTQRIYDNADDDTKLGRLSEEISPSGLRTTYTYDAHGNVLTKTERAPGIDNTTHFEYDASDNLLSTTDPRRHRTDYVYDALNRKTEERYVVGGVPHLRSYTYDAMGRLATVTNERGKPTTTHYDARGQVTDKINALNETTTYTYDPNGNVATVTDGGGHKLTYAYDALNRKTQQLDDKGNEQVWAYYPNGQVRSHRDARNNVTDYSYDASGHLTETRQDEQVTRSTYDGNGNLLTVTDPAEHTTIYTYDELNQRVSTTLHDGQQWVYEYDVAGNRISETTPNGEQTRQRFDALGRVTQRTEIATNQSITRQIDYTYDPNGNVTSVTSGGKTIAYTYDEINRIASVTDQSGQTLRYAYDLAGNRSRLTYPGNKTVSYSYDDADRLHSLTDWLNNTTRYTRNGAGQVTDILNGNATKSHLEYDDAGRLVQLQNLQANNSVISTHVLTLDAAGNITEATVDLPLMPTLPAGIDFMTYDNTNRLRTAPGTTYTHDDSGRIIEEDANGVKTSYQFDIQDHISRITRGATTLSQYAYDLNDNRISQIQSGVETRYVIDPLASLPNVVAETTAQGAISRYYIYGEGLVSQIDAAGTSHYYHFDPTGHTLALTDASGNVTDRYAYTPYGHTTSQGSTPNPFRFVGKHGVMDDGNGLHYMRARYYKEDIMRFVSLDALSGDILTPQALNRYAYTLGNPIANVDPSGYLSKIEKDYFMDKLAGKAIDFASYATKEFCEKAMDKGVFSRDEYDRCVHALDSVDNLGCISNPVDYIFSVSDAFISGNGVSDGTIECTLASEFSGEDYESCKRGFSDLNGVMKSNIISAFNRVESEASGDQKTSLKVVHYGARVVNTIMSITSLTGRFLNDLFSVKQAY